MKKAMMIAVFVIVLAVIFTIPATLFAAPGGAPAAHGVDGKTFGGLVSDLAKMYPGAVADHVSGN